MRNRRSISGISSTCRSRHRGHSAGGSKFCNRQYGRWRSGRNIVLVRGDANVRVDENEHDISTLSFKSQPSSERIKLTCEAATGDSAFIHYYYDTPPAPITELLTASVWVKSSKAGVQLRARVVFPKEADPANPQAYLASLAIKRSS